MTSLWKNYDAKSSYDEYLTPEKKLRKEAKITVSYTHLRAHET